MKKEFIESKNGHGVRVVTYNDNGQYVESHYITMRELNEFVSNARIKAQKEMINVLTKHTFVIPQGHITRGFKLEMKDIKEAFEKEFGSRPFIDDYLNG